eukprot:4104843-Karenia_brevis.AAC.1
MTLLFGILYSGSFVSRFHKQPSHASAMQTSSWRSSDSSHCVSFFLNARITYARGTPLRRAMGQFV